MNTTFLRLALLTCSSVPCVLIAYCQSQNNVWLGNTGIGLDFGQEPPAVLALDLSPVNYHWIASICDAEGEALFHATPGQVFDQELQLMQNGDLQNVQGNFPPLFPGTIVPKGPDASSYYFIWLRNSGSATSAFFTEVDMTQNEGLGAVVQNNMELCDGVTYNHTVVPASNGGGHWLLLRERFGYAWYAYLINGDGIASEPVESQVEAPYIFPEYGLGNHLRASLDGSMLVTRQELFGAGRALDLFNFDPATGLVSEPMRLIRYNEEVFHMAEFSPSGRYLYVTEGPHGSISQHPARLWQLDLISGDSATIAASAQLIYEHPVNPFPDATGYVVDMALSPDNEKIYVQKGEGNWIGVIHRPDEPGINCQFEPSAIEFPGVAFARLPHQTKYPRPQVSVPEVTEASELLFHPNPADGSVWLSLSSTLQGKMLTADWYDLSGRLVHAERFVSQDMQELDVPAVSGVYLVRLHDGNAHLATRRVLVRASR